MTFKSLALNFSDFDWIKPLNLVILIIRYWKKRVTHTLLLLVSLFSLMLMCRSLGPSSGLFVIIWHCQLYMDTAWNSLCNQVSHSTVLQSPLFCFEYKYCRSWCDNNGMEGWKTFPENMNVTEERRGCFSEWKKERERTHLTALQAEGEMVSFCVSVCEWETDTLYPFILQMRERWGGRILF